MHLYIERVFLLHLRLEHLQVLYVVFIILVILNVHTGIIDIFEHIAFSSQIDLVWHSLNLRARFLSLLTISTLFLLSHRCLRY